MPKPGQFGLSRIGGWTGIMVTLGQWLIGDLSRYSHAFIVLDNGQVAEAMPGGLQINPLSRYDHKDVVYSDIPLTDDQRATIIATARGLKGRPYSYLEYLYLGLSHFRKCPKWIKRKVASSGNLICSQAVDYCYNAAGVRLFTDGRLPHDVTPGDLCRLLFADRA